MPNRSAGAPTSAASKRRAAAPGFSAIRTTPSPSPRSMRWTRTPPNCRLPRHGAAPPCPTPEPERRRLPPARSSLAPPPGLGASPRTATRQPARRARARNSKARISFPLSYLCALWPEPIRSEALEMSEANVELPAAILARGLAKGRVVFTWAQLRSWMTPPPASTAGDEATELNIPLKAVAPLFMAHSRPAPRRHSIELDTAIPALFTGNITEELPPFAPAEPLAEAALPPPARIPEPAAIHPVLRVHSVHRPRAGLEFPPCASPEPEPAPAPAARARADRAASTPAPPPPPPSPSSSKTPPKPTGPPRRSSSAPPPFPASPAPCSRSRRASSSPRISPRASKATPSPPSSRKSSPASITTPARWRSPPSMKSGSPSRACTSTPGAWAKSISPRSSSAMPLSPPPRCQLVVRELTAQAPK